MNLIAVVDDRNGMMFNKRRQSRGEIPGQEKGTAVFCCPDVDTINVFRIEREDQ